MPHGKGMPFGEGMAKPPRLPLRGVAACPHSIILSLRGLRSRPWQSKSGFQPFNSPARPLFIGPSRFSGPLLALPDVLSATRLSLTCRRAKRRLPLSYSILRGGSSFDDGQRGARCLWSRKPSSLRARTGCWSFLMALASTCRTRSRVTLKILPTSSRVYV